MAQDLSAAGAELPILMQAGRWSTSAMPARYTEAQAPGRRERSQTGSRRQEDFTVTAEEERLLKAYLGLDGKDFEDWYLQRFNDEAADQEYKSVLAEARAFEAGRVRAFDEILVVLDTLDHPAGCECRPCETIRMVRESITEHEAAAGQSLAEYVLRPRCPYCMLPQAPDMHTCGSLVCETAWDSHLEGLQ